MQNLSKIMVAVVAGSLALTLATGAAFAEKPVRSDNPETYPKGIRDKLTQNQDGSYSFTGNKNGNGNLGKKWSDSLARYNASLDGEEGGDEVSNSQTIAVLCPTTLDDEAMRLCLGLPAVKKAVRVKRLNVQIGKAE